MSYKPDIFHQLQSIKQGLATTFCLIWSDVYKASCFKAQAQHDCRYLQENIKIIGP